MTTSDLSAALMPVATCLEGLGVRYYLTGSVASSAHGVARASLDVDLVAELEPHHAVALRSCLGSAYYVSDDHRRAAIDQRRSFNVIHLDTIRRGGEVSERQWWDIVGILKVTRNADREYLRTWAAALGVTDLLARALSEADGDMA